MPTIHEDHGERAPRAAHRSKRTLCVLALALIAPGAHASPSLCPTGGPPKDTGTYDLTIKFEGVIAFAPRGHQGGADKPDGMYKEVVALIPRTDLGGTPGKVFGEGRVPPSFYVPWERYPLHHPVVRVRARHFAGRLPDVCQPPDRGDCADHWVYLSLAANDPVRPPTHDQAPQYAAYDVSIETGTSDACVEVKGFAYVPRLLDSAGPDAAGSVAAAEPCDHCFDFGSSNCTEGVPSLAPVDERLAARVRLRSGETLSAGHVIAEQGRPIEFEWRARTGCQRVSGSPAPELVTCDPLTASGPSASFQVARHVVATRTLSRDQPVTLVLRGMTDGCVVHRYLLRPPAAGDPPTLEVEILNLPAEGTLDLPTDETAPALAHFNLFHLLAKATAPALAPEARRFYFPHPPSNVKEDGRPWCSNAYFDPQ